MNFTFDNDRPIYVQLVEQIKIQIISGKISPGEKLPSVRELATLTKANPNTVQKALAELEIGKLIYTERTNGKFVTKDEALIKNFKEDFAEQKVKSFLEDMKKLGFTESDTIIYLQKRGEE